MAREFRIDDAEQALIAALQANAVIGASGINVSGITSESLDDSGALITLPPAILVLYERTIDNAAAHPRRLTYATTHFFQIICGDKNLASAAAERNSAYGLVADVRAAVAGLVLALTGGQSTEPIELLSSEIISMDSKGTWYTQRIAVAASAQFGA